MAKCSCHEGWVFNRLVGRDEDSRDASGVQRRSHARNTLEVGHVVAIKIVDFDVVDHIKIFHDKLGTHGTRAHVQALRKEEDNFVIPRLLNQLLSDLKLLGIVRYARTCIRIRRVRLCHGIAVQRDHLGICGNITGREREQVETHHGKTWICTSL